MYVAPSYQLATLLSFSDCVTDAHCRHVLRVDKSASRVDVIGNLHELGRYSFRVNFHAVPPRLHNGRRGSLRFVTNHSMCCIDVHRCTERYSLLRSGREYDDDSQTLVYGTPYTTGVSCIKQCATRYSNACRKCQ